MRKKRERKRTLEVDALKSDYELLQKLTRNDSNEVDDTSDARLHLIARSELSQSIPIAQLKSKLKARLQELPYPYPEERNDKRQPKTFFQILRSHAADEVLLSHAVLKEIASALQLVEIARIDSQYEKDELSGYRSPLKFHRAMLKEIIRHQARVDELHRKHLPFGSWASNYRTEIRLQKMKEISAIASSAWPGDRKEILGSGWKPKLASAVRVFYVLIRSLRGTRLSKRYLRSLALIIVSDEDRPKIEPDNFRIAISRRSRSK